MKESSLSKYVFPDKNDLHWQRKLWHIGVGFSIFVLYRMYGNDLQSWGKVIFAFGFFSYILDKIRISNVSLNKITIGLFAPFLRETEKFKPSGLPFYALGVGVTLIFFKEDFALISVLILIFADPLSSFVGIQFGKNNLVNGKSLEGTLTFFLITALIYLIYMGTLRKLRLDDIAIAFFVGVFSSISELFPIVDDNLSIPILTGLFITILNIVYPFYLT